MNISICTTATASVQVSRALAPTSHRHDWTDGNRRFSPTVMGTDKPYRQRPKEASPPPT